MVERQLPRTNICINIVQRFTTVWSTTVVSEAADVIITQYFVSIKHGFQVTEKIITSCIFKFRRYVQKGIHMPNL